VVEVTSAIETPRRGNERLLLVEDETALQRATSRILGQQGYEVVLASDGVEALEIFGHDGNGIALVLTDMAMPRMRGDELAQELSARRPEVAIIVMSGYDFGDAPLANRLTKPVAPEALLRAVREALDG